MADVNLTDASGELREFTLTGMDVMDIEQEFSSQVSDAIETFLWDSTAISEYQKGECLP